MKKQTLMKKVRLGHKKISRLMIKKLILIKKVILKKKIWTPKKILINKFNNNIKQTFINKTHKTYK